MKSGIRNLFERPRSVAIIQARMSSSRLPGKVMLPLAGMPMIWHIVERARQCVLVDRVVVATSAEPSDDPLAEFCESIGIEVFRGALFDVRSRFLSILDKYQPQFFVRITGDCPLICPEFIDFQVSALAESGADIIRLEMPSPLLEGQGVFSSKSLFLVARYSDHADDCEHVGSRFIAENQHLFKPVGVKLPHCFTSFECRLTVDEVADYEMISAVYDRLWDGTGSIIPLAKVINFLKDNPDICQINSATEHSQINSELMQKRKLAATEGIVWKRWAGLGDFVN